MDYSYLGLQGQAIRVLSITPDDEQAEIQCSARVVQLSENPSYDAISHRWSDAALDKEILVDNKPVYVPSSTFVLLRHLRESDHDRCFWLDLLSIDQSNVAERNQQVALMGTIFSSAQRVIAWLGPEQEDVAEAFHLLNNFSPTPHDVDESSTSLSARALHFANQISGESLRGLIDLCHHKYWSRTWIIQEVLLAREVVLQSGCHRVSLQLVRKALDSEQSYPVLWYFVKGTMCCLLLEHPRPSVRLRLAEVLKRYNHSSCQDPRDKIYALLSMASDRAELAMLEPDYNKPVETLYQEVLVNVAEDESKLFQEMMEGMLAAALPFAHDFDSLPPEANRFFHVWERDTAIYAGVIVLRKQNCALRIYKDEASGVNRFQAASRTGEILWIATFDEHVTCFGETVEGPPEFSEVFVDNIQLFCCDGAWLPPQSEDGIVLTFEIEGDASGFMYWMEDTRKSSVLTPLSD